jgi:hypothetical protein
LEALVTCVLRRLTILGFLFIIGLTFLVLFADVAVGELTFKLFGVLVFVVFIRV